MDQAVVDFLLPALHSGSGVQLLGAYQVSDSGEGYFLRQRFEPFLMLLFADDADPHAARHAIKGLRINWREVLNGPPLVFTLAMLKRHARLFPLFAQHVTKYAQRLSGQDLPVTSAVKAHPVERLAFLITMAIDASAALVPTRAGPHNLLELQRLSAQLSGKSSADNPSATDLFARVQIYLRHYVDSLPVMTGHRLPIVKSASAPNLLAFYEDQQRLLVIIPPLSASLLRMIDWSAIARPMPSHLTTLNVATTDQLYLTIQIERSLDFVLGSYRHQWGADLLSGLEVPARSVFRQAARKPSQALVEGLLGAYLMAPGDESVHRVIHDYQNRLLNMRLEHELLCRLLNVPISEPPNALPRRDESLAERIDAIIEHFDWWSSHYLSLMEASEPEQRLGPP